MVKVRLQLKFNIALFIAEIEKIEKVYIMSENRRIAAGQKI